MRRVILESPYAGDVLFNEAYARACMHDVLMQGDTVYASHLLYTQPGVLDDGQPWERDYGIQAGHAWLLGANLSVVYMDLGFSSGMIAGISAARKCGVELDFRTLPLSTMRALRQRHYPWWRHPIHTWDFVAGMGGYEYLRCRVCHVRTVRVVDLGGRKSRPTPAHNSYTPLDKVWVRTGVFREKFVELTKT
jgi:hypothetical protein